MNVAVLGAGSHIAKGLIRHFLLDGVDRLEMYARRVEPVRDFLKKIGAVDFSGVHDLLEFGKHDLDVIINCIGVGAPRKALKMARDILFVTETYDNLVLAYLERFPGCRYLNFSSGAVFGRDFPRPVDESFSNCLRVNWLGDQDFYGLAKLTSELRHRVKPDYWIVDLRVFSYFSRFIDLESGFLISEIVSNLQNGTVFSTNNSNVTRDFVVPHDLYSLVRLCLEQRQLNTSYDVYSRAPIAKTDLLEWFRKEYGFRFSIAPNLNFDDPTGSKENYYSINQKAAEIGYRPQFTSLEGIKIELDSMVSS